MASNLKINEEATKHKSEGEVNPDLPEGKNPETPNQGEN